MMPLCKVFCRDSIDFGDVERSQEHDALAPGAWVCNLKTRDSNIRSNRCGRHARTRREWSDYC